MPACTCCPKIFPANLDSVKTVLLKHGIASASLTNAVRTLMQTSGWHTVANVRTLLEEHGFNFSEYKTNALASVATTLRRLKDADQLEATKIKGLLSIAQRNSSETETGVELMRLERVFLFVIALCFRRVS